MGYSCSARAGNRLRCLVVVNHLMFWPECTVSNAFKNEKGKKYFYEHAAEQRDGSIVGDVYWEHDLDSSHVGKFKINPSGDVSFFNSMPLICINETSYSECLAVNHFEEAIKKEGLGIFKTLRERITAFRKSGKFYELYQPEGCEILSFRNRYPLKEI